ncbi:DNA polymerase [Xanthobacter sp. YC-JY1]|uniref:DNA polymerase n=1 Tax=Xanthobacter sp. YC-JY1 TaxID=2419844 RepID=UPI001F02DFC1|nr:DNA polymerase [Xanthobacter sp. YC-JY1]
MKTLVFDIETDGLLDELTKVHCLVIADPATGQMVSCSDHAGYEPVQLGLRLLAEADLILGHNVIGFDIPALQKVYPDWKPRGIVRDTLILGHLLYPKEVIEAIDFPLADKGRLPKQLIGRQSLEAWGHRLGEYKGDYKGGWESWSSIMQDYCEQDVAVTCKLWKRQQDELATGWGEECVKLEHDLAWIIQRQERRGFAFDVPAAQRLYATLSARRQELADELMKVFPPKEVRTPFTPKANNKARGYVKGVLTHKVKVVPFNPGSRKQVAERMMQLGWKPNEFTKDGTPKLDDEILGTLPYPQAKVLAEYFLVAKRLGQLGDGREAWIRKEKRGRVFGRVIQNGAVTGRMTHRVIANVPRVGTPYGKEMRALFMASTGFVLVGCDADALELRCLAGFMARYDGGAYIKTVLEGKKEEGTDMHTLNAAALGCDRETAKTWFYAFIYGAGDFKLGLTLLGLLGRQKLISAGKHGRAKFLAKIPAMGRLVAAVAKAVKGRGYLIGLDGRKLRVRGEHSALNTLLQSAGAVLMKKAQVILDADLQAAGLVPGEDYEFVITYHDEWQLEARPHLAETVGTLAADAIRKAGQFFAFRCPLKGNFDIGPNWAATH